MTQSARLRGPTFWDKVVVWGGHEAAEEHFAELPIDEIARLFGAGGFEVLEMEFPIPNRIVSGRKP